MTGSSSHPQPPAEVVVDPAAWTREEIAQDRSWMYPIDQRMARELRDALHHAKARALPQDLHRHRLSPTTFPLRSAAALVRAALRQLEHGRGLALVRGLPIGAMSIDDCKLLFDGFTSHLGTSVVQDTAGTLLGEVRDQGLSYDSIAIRGYMTRAHLTPHCDSGDLVALMCVRQAKSGGNNIVSSALAVYEEIRATQPWRLDILHRGFYYNIRGNGPPGRYRDLTSHRVPVYSMHAGRLSCRFNEKAILTSEQLGGAPPLSDVERSTVELVAALASDQRFSLELRLEPGDVLLLCNHSVLHNRRSFEDADDGAGRRLLLRKWINVPQGRALTWEFGDHYNTGIRQGPYVTAGYVAAGPRSG